MYRAWLKEDGPGSGDMEQWDFIYLQDTNNGSRVDCKCLILDISLIVWFYPLHARTEFNSFVTKIQ